VKNVTLTPAQADPVAYAALFGAGKKNKFGNKHTIVDGYEFDSKAEAARYGQLKMSEKAGEVSSIRRQVTYPLMINTYSVGTWTADFVYLLASGKEIIEDVKGIRLPVFNLKARIFYALYGTQIQCIDAHGKVTMVPNVPKAARKPRKETR
jgi:hypothetical protein